MNVLHTTALEVARNLFEGVEEIEGAEDHPLIMAALRMAAPWPEHDEVPWCAAVPFLTHTALGLPCPEKDGLMARSWLTVGQRIPLEEARPGFDLAVFGRGDNPPGVEILNAPGHVFYFVSAYGGRVFGWGGNQNDGFTFDHYPKSRLLAIQRVLPL